MRPLCLFVLLLGIVTQASSVETEIGPKPRVVAPFDLDEFVPLSKAKTTKITSAKEILSAIPPYLGVQFTPSKEGLKVAQVDPQSPAASVLKVNDEITAIDGKVFNTTTFREYMQSKSSGDKLNLDLKRGPTTEKVSVTLVPSSSPLTATGKGGNPGNRAVMGIQTENADKAVKISSVNSGSPAEKAELKVGDLILSIDGKKVTDTTKLTEILGEKKAGDPVKVLFTRDGKEMTKQVTLGSSNPGGGDAGSWDTRRGTFRKPVYKLAVITISYPDKSINPKISTKDWEDSLFSTNNYTTKSVTGQTVYGSMNDYYQEQSFGKLKVEGKVFAPVKVSKKLQEYSESQTRTALLSESIDLLRARDGDNCLKGFDGIFFLYAGPTATTQRAALYWPHRHFFSHKGERWDYFICPEGGTEMANISTICHEFGHMLGLPDLYAKPEVPGMEGVGAWCAMSNQARGGRPQHFCAWSKEQMNWVSPVVLDPSVPQKIILSPSDGKSEQVAKVLIKQDGSEYFLLEVRKKQGFDVSVPAEGLLIWRVTDGRPLLEESHGISGPNGPRSYPESVPFPSKANHSFTPFTVPSSKSLKGGGKEVFITNIHRLPDGRITFQIGYEFY